MPITVTRDDQRKLIVAVGTGTITAQDVFAFVRDHRSGILQTYRLLVDGREAQMRAQVSDATTLANQVATEARLSGGRGPTAIVAGTAVYLLATAYETLSHGAGVHVIRVFREIDEARQWLMAQPVSGSPGASSPPDTAE
jgi:hypothetical protein